MTPSEAILRLRDARMSDMAIASKTDVNLTTIYRIRTQGAKCRYELGEKLVALASALPVKRKGRRP